MDYQSLLKNATAGKIGLCVGLDPVIESMPPQFHHTSEPLLKFNLEIIEATKDIAAAYKPNFAFYEAYGASGWMQLEKTIQAIPSDIVIIGDAKRGDIGSTARAYAKALFDNLKVNSATVSPYLGGDAIVPFLESDEHGVFILTVTTNPGGSDVQQLIVDGKPLFYKIIQLARRLNIKRNIGLVVGATKPELLPEILENAIDLPLLIPGVGAQGGDVERLRKTLLGYDAPVFVNASRSILYASKKKDFAIAAKHAAANLRDQLRG